MMVSWHNWKLKLKRYWFSVWCWWSKWKDASWSQCDFPGRSTEDPGRSKSGVTAIKMVQRITHCRRLSYSNQRKVVRTPGGKLVFQVWFNELQVMNIAINIFFAVFEEAPLRAQWLALSRRVSPPPTTRKHKTGRMPLGVDATSLADGLRTQEDQILELQRHKIFQPPTPAPSATSPPRRQRTLQLPVLQVCRMQEQNQSEVLFCIS